MKIDKNMYLVAPISRADDSVLHVHSAPISKDLFDSYADVLEDTWGYFSAPDHVRQRMPMAARRAAVRLRIVAKALGKTDEVERGLMPEIRRSTNVGLFNNHKWQDEPYQDLMDRKGLDEEEIDEIDSFIIFFMLASRLQPSVVPKNKRRAWTTGLVEASGGQITSLGFTEYLHSLPTSIKTDSSGENAAAAA